MRTPQQDAVRGALVAMYQIDRAIGNEPYVPPGIARSLNTSTALLAAVSPGSRLAARSSAPGGSSASTAAAAAPVMSSLMSALPAPGGSSASTAAVPRSQANRANLRPAAPPGTLPGLFGTRPLPSIEQEDSGANTNNEDEDEVVGSGSGSSLSSIFSGNNTGSNSNADMLLSPAGKRGVVAERRAAAAVATPVAPATALSGMQYFTRGLAKKGKVGQGGGARKSRSRKHFGLRNRKTQRRK